MSLAITNDWHKERIKSNISSWPLPFFTLKPKRICIISDLFLDFFGVKNPGERLFYKPKVFLVFFFKIKPFLESWFKINILPSHAWGLDTHLAIVFGLQLSLNLIQPRLNIFCTPVKLLLLACFLQFVTFKFCLR